MNQTIDYKGYRIRIVQDEDYQSPNDWGNEDLFLVYDHRQFLVERKGFSPSRIYDYMWAKEQVDDNNDSDGDYKEEMESYSEYEAYWIFPVDAYIHSGVHLSLANTRDYPDRRWDVSTSGYVLAKKECWKDVEDAYKVAESLIEEWNQCLSGEIYGFVVEKPNTTYTISKENVDTMITSGMFTSEEFFSSCEEDVDWEQVDSCWGYYGDPEESGCLSEARSVIDNLVKDE